jgi:integrase
LDAAKYADCSDTYKHNLIRAIQAPFNWALERKELKKQIGENPLAGLEKPAQTARDVYATEDQWRQIIAGVKDECFRDFLEICHETGCRPIEARMVTAENFDRENRQWYFADPPKKLRGKKRPRIVRLNDRAFEICQRLALKHPSGPLLRNADRQPWKKNALNCRRKRLREKLGFYFTPYATRHSFVTDALKRGADPVSVAELLGQKDTKMIMEVYLARATRHYWPVANKSLSTASTACVHSTGEVAATICVEYDARRLSSTDVLDVFAVAE